MELGSKGVMAFNAPTLQSSIAPFFVLVPEVGIAPTSPRLQRGANLPQLPGVRLRAMRYGAMSSGSPSRSSESEGWSSRAVTLRGLPLIRRALCS